MNKSSHALATLIEERLRPGADTNAIDARIEALFGERWCVVFTDMAGFSRRAHREGIVPFLVLIHQLEKIILPIARRHAGLDLKKIADSHLLVFRDPREALRACVEMQQAIHRYNAQVADLDKLYMGAGIGYGACLKLGDEDIFGIEVNFAAKLGEDLAGPYQIFVSPDALTAIGKLAGIKFTKVKGSRLGGTKLPYYEAHYSLDGEVKGERKKAQKARVRFK